MALERWLVAGGLCSLASLCGSCAPSAPASVAIAQAQGQYTSCAGLALEERAGCRRPSHEPTIPITAAADPPNFNMSTTCQSSTAKWCLVDETSARDDLAKNWQRYSAADKMQCVGMINRGGPPSYVELISCLGTMKEASALEATDTATRRVEPGLIDRGLDNRHAERQLARGSADGVREVAPNGR
jgi:hypothetical protein